MIAKDSNFQRYHLAEEFANPFFVVVHANGDVPNNINSPLYDRVMSEIEQIKLKHDWVPMNEWPPQTIPDGVPRNRPILVCGFFDGTCVQDQRDSLRREGYDAYISRRGTY